MRPDNIIDLERGKVLLKLRDAGFKTYEDKTGKFRLWVRKTPSDPINQSINKTIGKTVERLLARPIEQPLARIIPGVFPRKR